MNSIEIPGEPPSYIVEACHNRTLTLFQTYVVVTQFAHKYARSVPENSGRNGRLLVVGFVEAARFSGGQPCVSSKAKLSHYHLCWRLACGLAHG